MRADATELPINIPNVGPSIGGRYTTTLYVDVKDSGDRPISGGEVGCSYTGGLDTGALYYLDGDPEHETTETIDDVEITTPNAYRSVTLSTNAGLATFHFHASDVAGPATVRCTVTDDDNVVRSDEVTIQVGSNTPSGKVSQVVFDSSSQNYLFVQGYNGPTQLQLQVNVVDEAGQPIVNFPAGVNNLQLRIVPDPASLADDDATLRGVDAYGQAVAGTSILVRSTNGQAQFTLVSGNAAGMIATVVPVQVLLTSAIAVLFVYPLLEGRDGAIGAAGFIGFGLGAMPVGLSSINRLALTFGDAPRAVLVITLAASLFTDTANALIVQTILTWCAE